MSRYIQRASNTNLLLTRWTGTRPALGAATIWSTRGFSRSSSGSVCLVAARVRKALTSENWGTNQLVSTFQSEEYVRQTTQDTNLRTAISQLDSVYSLIEEPGGSPVVIVY